MNLFVSDMNENISTFKGKMVEVQATNQELVFKNKHQESTLEGNQYVLKNETGWTFTNYKHSSQKPVGSV